MWVHSVYFWLDRKLEDERRQAFEKALEGLREAEGVESVYVGRPADVTRPVVDRTYDYALTVLFRDRAAHDAYQESRAHREFLEKYTACWIRVVIYDAC